MAHKGRIMTVLFCGFLAGLLVWHIALPDRARSETENRSAGAASVPFPETLLNGASLRIWKRILPTSSPCGTTGRTEGPV